MLVVQKKVFTKGCWVAHYRVLGSTKACWVAHYRVLGSTKGCWVAHYRVLGSSEWVEGEQH